MEFFGHVMRRSGLEKLVVTLVRLKVQKQEETKDEILRQSRYMLTKQHHSVEAHQGN